MQAKTPINVKKQKSLYLKIGHTKVHSYYSSLEGEELKVEDADIRSGVNLAIIF